MKKSLWAVVIVLSVATCRQALLARAAPISVCARPEPGSTVQEPADLRSKNGVLDVQLTANDAADARGSKRYCYTDAAGRESPTLRVHPGDLIILHLKNELAVSGSGGTAGSHAMSHMSMSKNSCTNGIMSPVSTNLHFHGMTMPPVCHQDDVLKTSVQPGDAPFEYRFRIPESEPAGSEASFCLHKAQTDVYRIISTDYLLRWRPVFPPCRQIYRLPLQVDCISGTIVM